MTTTPHQTSSRLASIDILRGVALCCMIVYHALFDAHLFGFITAPDSFFYIFDSIFWSFFQKITAITFLVLSGVSLQLKANKAQKNNHTFLHFIRSVVIQAFPIALGALSISVATCIITPNSMVVFGVLHLLAVALILNTVFVWFAQLQKFVLPVALTLIVVGTWINYQTFATEHLHWLGFRSSTFQSLDYFPIVPYWGVTLLGVFMTQKIDLFKVNAAFLQRKNLNTHSASHRISLFLQKMGENSLLIYLLHQPVIIFGFWVIA